jgi:hypothetical protein
MKIVVRLCALLLLVPLAIAATAATEPRPEEPPPEAPAPRYDLRTLHAELGRVVQRHYPGCTSHVLDGKIYFERDTRVFLVHHPLKTGEWQDPMEERGPKLNGIIVEVAIAPGPYGGAAMVPQSFDHHYFTRFVTAPYSEKLDAHLHVTVKHGARAPQDFLKELTATLDRFDEHVSKPGK